jgi:predicted RNase H-like nuclease (RuvC/YqgF family)
MSKILLAVSALLIAASAFFGFSLKNTVSDLRGKEATLTSNLNAEKAALAKSEAERKALDEQLAVANTKAEASAKEAADAQAELAKAQAQATDLQAQITAKNEEITKLNTQIAAAPGGPAAVPATEELTQLQTQVKELQTKLAEAQEINKTVMAKANDAESRLKVLQDQENKRQGKLMARGLEGQVLAVNQGWSFVVLGIGDRQGVVPNAEMVLVRGGQAIGKVRVSSVEPSTSIADIVPGSLARGVRVQPGDRVIYPGGA